MHEAGLVAVGTKKPILVDLSVDGEQVPLGEAQLPLRGGEMVAKSFHRAPGVGKGENTEQNVVIYQIHFNLSEVPIFSF